MGKFSPVGTMRSMVATGDDPENRNSGLLCESIMNMLELNIDLDGDRH